MASRLHRPVKMTGSNSNRRSKVGCCGPLLAICAWLCLSTAAMAHASLTRAEPADGAVVGAGLERFLLTFSEPVTPLVLSVIGPDGVPVTLTDVDLQNETLSIALPGTLMSGTYVLSWRVTSQDGHPISGATIFSIGLPSQAPPIIADDANLQVRSALWLAKLGLYAGLFFGIGGVFSVNVIVEDRAVANRLVRSMIALGLISGMAAAAFQGLDALGAPISRVADPLVWQAGFNTSFGNTLTLMFGAFVLCGFATMTTAARVATALSLAGIVTGSLALVLSGHASAVEPRWLTQISVFLHAASISVWIGALLPLARALQNGGSAGRRALMRFSGMIPFVVLVLVASGAGLAFVQVQHPSALLNTAYGRLLVAKLCLVAMLLMLAGVNRWRLTKRAAADDPDHTRALLRSIAAETVLVLLLLGVAAAWRFTPPPRSLTIAAAQSMSVHLHTADKAAELIMSPARVGPVKVTAVIMGEDLGSSEAREVTFFFSHPTAGIEPIRRNGHSLGDGRWEVDDIVLPVAGPWTVRLDILISDFKLAKLQGIVDLKS